MIRPAQSYYKLSRFYCYDGRWTSISGVGNILVVVVLGRDGGFVERVMMMACLVVSLGEVYLVVRLGID